MLELRILELRILEPTEGCRVEEAVLFWILGPSTLGSYPLLSLILQGFWLRILEL